MSGFLLDTNCISELVRPKPQPQVVEWFEGVDESLLYLSVLTLGEIRKGLGTLPRSTRRSRLEAWLEVDLRARFSGRVLPIDESVADQWGLLSAEAKREGKPLAVIDGLLAATAFRHRLALVTRNTADFKITHVPVVNPWES